ncbi:MAG TPA: PaaI family thioesterase [Actinomycetota bacterium]
MQARPGPFWDGVQGRAPVPPAAATWASSSSAPTSRRAPSRWRSRPPGAFTNPAGNVLGGFLAAMLFDTVGPALLATLGPGQFQSTQQLNVSFLRPVRPGRLLGKGRIVHRDGDLVFLEASLLDGDGALVATATATARVIPRNQTLAAP